MCREGLDFLAPHAGLKSASCFVAMEAVEWAMEKINGVKTRKDATKLLQVGGVSSLVKGFHVIMMDGITSRSNPSSSLCPVCPSFRAQHLLTNKPHLLYTCV